MKILIMTTALAVVSPANAVTVPTHYNLNSFLTTGAGKDGGRRNFTVNDGNGSTISITATLASGQTFTSLFGVPGGPNDHIGVNTAAVGGGGQNHWSNTEDVTFTVSYVSFSPNVTVSSIGFIFGSIGYRTIDAGPTLSWKVNGGTPARIPTSGGADANYNLDGAGVFTSLSSLYTGVLETSSTGNGHLCRG